MSDTELMWCIRILRVKCTITVISCPLKKPHTLSNVNRWNLANAECIFAMSCRCIIPSMTQWSFFYRNKANFTLSLHLSMTSKSFCCVTFFSSFFLCPLKPCMCLYSNRINLFWVPVKYIYIYFCFIVIITSSLGMTSSVCFLFSWPTKKKTKSVKTKAIKVTM